MEGQYSKMYWPPLYKAKEKRFQNMIKKHSLDWQVPQEQLLQVQRGSL